LNERCQQKSRFSAPHLIKKIANSVRGVHKSRASKPHALWQRLWMEREAPTKVKV